MVRFRFFSLALCCCAGLILLAASPASADPVADAASQLRTGELYVAPGSGLTVDQAAASSALASSGRPIKIAVLPPGSGNTGQLAIEIGQALGGTLTVGVFIGHSFNAGSNQLCAHEASAAASAAVTANKAQLQSSNDITATVKSFIANVGKARTCASNSGSDSSGARGNTGGGTQANPGGGNGGWFVVLGLGAAAAAAVGALMVQGRRRTRRELADARAELQPFYDRLAADIGSLQPGSDPTARQALADASERFNSGGSQLNSARSVAQLAGARRSLLEGLQASRAARVALGLDPGAELPPIAQPTVTQLSDPQQLQVGNQTVQGYPQYTPGAPYYFVGGGGYAGGWYSTPFWQSLLIAEALTPGWGMGGWGYGGWGGGGYGSGYDSGFDRGYDAGTERGGSGGGGGDWSGSNSGGDWGSSSGGGDWSGGGSGGGDWGGGGGGDSGGSW